MDFNARQYDPQIGRFLGVDPLADFGGQDRYSPYAAMGNMPESTIDPNGLAIENFRDPLEGVHNYAASSGQGDGPGGGGGGELAGSVGTAFWGGEDDILDPMSFTFGKYTQQKMAESTQRDAEKRNAETTGQTSNANKNSDIKNNDGTDVEGILPNDVIERIKLFKIMLDE